MRLRLQQNRWHGGAEAISRYGVAVKHTHHDIAVVPSCRMVDAVNCGRKWYCIRFFADWESTWSWRDELYDIILGGLWEGMKSTHCWCEYVVMA